MLQQSCRPRRSPQLKVTIFGAESVGKTTLSLALSKQLNCLYVEEFAREYLEQNGGEVTTEAMFDIWIGQRQLQINTRFYSGILVVQDTDLFSTVGYWDFWNGLTPYQLADDAIKLKSDLYIICPSNIPFVADPLRFGGDVRESTDQYWIDLCEDYGLNYAVLNRKSEHGRLLEALALIDQLW